MRCTVLQPSVTKGIPDVVQPSPLPGPELRVAPDGSPVPRKQSLHFPVLPASPPAPRGLLSVDLPVVAFHINAAVRYVAFCVWTLT